MRTVPTIAERRALLERLRFLGSAVTTPVQLATRVGISHVTVRKYLRKLGLYVPRGTAAERKAVEE